MISKIIWRLEANKTISKVTKLTNKLFANGIASTEYAIIGNDIAVNDVVILIANRDGQEFTKRLKYGDILLEDGTTKKGWSIISNGEELNFDLQSGTSEISFSFEIKRFSQNNELVANFTTQTDIVNVYPSATYRPQAEATDVEKILKDINDIEVDVLGLHDTKQDKEDNTLETTEKTVVGAINGLNTRVTQNESDIGDNATEISNNAGRITNLENQALTGLDRIGTYPTQAEFPTSAELDAFVLANTDPQRQRKNGDYVNFVLSTTGAKYNIYFAQNQWQPPDEQEPLDKATNENYGIVKGSRLENNNTQVDMVGGKIKNILTKDLSNNPVNIHTRLNSLDQKQQNIITGVQPVGKAQKAVKDENGLNIAFNYALKENHYDKNYIDDNFLRNTYTNIYYYSANGIVDDIPTTPENQVQFDVNTNSIGDTQIFKINRTTTAKYNFNKNTTDQSKIWIVSDRDCVAEFRLSTFAEKNSVEKLLSAELSGEIIFTANTPKAIQVQSIYNLLENEEYELPIGNKIIKQLDVIMTESTATNFKILSGTTNPSSVNLVAQSISFNVNNINGKKKIEILANEWVDNGDGTYSIVITRERHQQAPSDEYGLDLQYKINDNLVQRLAFTPTISSNGDITITSYQAIDCELLIWTAIDVSLGGELQTTNVFDVAKQQMLDVTLSNIEQKANDNFDEINQLVGDITDLQNLKWADDITADLTLNGTNEVTYNIGFMERPKNNYLIIKVTQGNHSYNGNLLFDNDSQNAAESTIKLNNEDLYFSIDYDSRLFKVSKTGAESESLKFRIFEQR